MTPPNVQQLFQSACDEGVLSHASLQALDVIDLGHQIQAGLGIAVDDVMASEVVLVTLMPDDSASIAYAGNVQAVRGGHNMVLDALADCQQKSSILVHTRYLNGEVLFPYRSLDQAVRMDTDNYQPDKGTPLYDQAMVVLGTVLAKSQEFADNGVPVRTITLMITDGEDTSSRRASASTVATLVQDMLRSENHIVAAMGIDDGSTNFHQVFRAMGIRDEWILTPGNSATEIRHSFQVFSQAAVQMSQSATQFSPSALGGFGSP